MSQATFYVFTFKTQDTQKLITKLPHYLHKKTLKVIFYIGNCMFISSITESHVISAIISILVLLLYMMGSLTSMISSDGKISPTTNTIKVTDSNEKSNVIYIGSVNPYDSTLYYIMIKKDDTQKCIISFLYATDGT